MGSAAEVHADFSEAGRDASVPTAARKPRRMTGAALVRQLLKQPGLAGRLKDPRVVPLAGKAVLGAVASLVVAWGNDGLYDEHVRNATLTPGGLETRVIEKLRFTNSAEAEAQVRDLLQALHRAELLDLSPEGVRLPIPAPVDITPVPADVVVAQDNAGVGGGRDDVVRMLYRSPGNRPAGMTDADWNARVSGLRDVLAAQERYTELRKSQDAFRQRTIHLPIAGGLSSPQSEINDNSAGISGPAADDFSSPGSGISGHSRVPIADDPDIQIQSTSSASDIGAREDRGHFDIAAPHIVEADRLAHELIQMFEWRQDKTRGIVIEVRQWFEAGLTRADVMPKAAELHERHRKDRSAGLPGIKSVNYLTKSLGGALDAKRFADRVKALPQRSTTPEPSTAALVERDVRLSSLTPGESMWATRAFERLDRLEAGSGITGECPPPGHEAFRAVSLARAQSRPAFDAVVAVYPQVAAWFGEGGPARDSVRYPQLAARPNPGAEQLSPG